MADECPSVSDDDLLAKAQRGDAHSFGLWVERHYDFIYRIAYRLLGHQMDAEDLTQDVCVALPDKLRKYSRKGSARGWLAQVVLNAGRDRLRKVKRLRTDQLNEEMPLAGHDNPAQQLYLQQVLRILKTLPEKSQDALLLTAEGLTLAELALALDCSEGTAGWRVSTARTELSKRLQEGNHVASR
jgi:RNA polymerase sigma-70 factor (ECF subfamily)